MAKSKKTKSPPTAPLVGSGNALPITSNILKITVGKNDDIRDFNIHESLLTARSRFFAKAMGKGWQEAEDKAVKLPEDKPEIFALYEQLVYTGMIPIFDEKLDRIIDEGGKTHCCNYPMSCQAEYETLVRLYVLAEKLQDIKAKNSAVAAMIAKVKHETDNIYNGAPRPCLPNETAIKIMYSNTAKHCPGRQALLDCYSWYGQFSSDDHWHNKEMLPHQFLLDLATDLMRLRLQPLEGLPGGFVERYYESESEENKWHVGHEWIDLYTWRGEEV